MKIPGAMLLVCMTACSHLAYAADPPAQPLTLQQALQILRMNNPALRAAQSHQLAARSGEVTAALRPNPVFTSANQDFRVFTPSEIDPANAQEFTNSLAWTIERGGKRSSRIASARAATLVGNGALLDTQRQLEFQLKSAFVNFVLAKQLLVLAEDNLKEYQQTVAANQLRLQAGDISQTEFDRIKIEEARFEGDLFNARSSVEQARAQMAALLGIQDFASVDVVGSLAPPPAKLDLDQLLAEALANRPDYQAARNTVLKNQADVRLARANGATDLSVAPEYKRNGPDNTMGVTLSFPLRIYDRNQGEKQRAGFELESSRFAENAARLQVISDVQQAWSAYLSASGRSQLYNTDYLQRAREVRDRIAFSYQHGAVNLLDYLDAVRSYRDVELAGLTANANLLTAIHQLSFATATELLP